MSDQQLEDEFYENSKGGADLVGVMIVCSIAIVFGLMIGFCIGRCV